MSTTSSLPRFFFSGSNCSLCPIVSREALPTFLAFVEDIKCVPEFAISLAGELHLQSKDGGYVPCSAKFLDWVEQLQPHHYPTPRGRGAQSEQHTQTADPREPREQATPPALPPEELERLLKSNNLLRYVKACFAVSGQEITNEIRQVGQTRQFVSVVTTGKQVLAEEHGDSRSEAIEHALLTALRRLNPDFADRWVQQH